MDSASNSRDRPRGVARPVDELTQARRQTAARDELHAEVAETRVLTHFVNRHDVGMIEIGDCLGFEAKAPAIVFGGEDAGQNHFESDRPIQAHLARFKDNAHAAARQLANQFVVTKIVD